MCLVRFSVGMSVLGLIYKAGVPQIQLAVSACSVVFVSLYVISVVLFEYCSEYELQLALTKMLLILPLSNLSCHSSLGRTKPCLRHRQRWPLAASGGKTLVESKKINPYIVYP